MHNQSQLKAVPIVVYSYYHRAHQWHHHEVATTNSHWYKTWTAGVFHCYRRQWPFLLQLLFSCDHLHVLYNKHSKYTVQSAYCKICHSSTNFAMAGSAYPDPHLVGPCERATYHPPFSRYSNTCTISYKSQFTFSLVAIQLKSRNRYKIVAVPARFEILELSPFAMNKISFTECKARTIPWMYVLNNCHLLWCTAAPVSIGNFFYACWE